MLKIVTTIKGLKGVSGLLLLLLAGEYSSCCLLALAMPHHKDSFLFGKSVRRPIGKAVDLYGSFYVESTVIIKSRKAVHEP